LATHESECLTCEEAKRHLLTLIVFASLSIGNLTGQGGNEAPSADALARDQRSSLRGDQPQSGQRMRGAEGSRLFSWSSSRSTATDSSSLTAHMLTFFGLALPQRLQSCVREFESPKIEVRSVPCFLARCGYQSGRKGLVPLESKTCHVTNDSP